MAEEESRPATASGTPSGRRPEAAEPAATRGGRREPTGPMRRYLALPRLIPLAKGLLPLVVLLTAAGAVAYLVDTRPEPSVVESDQRIWPVATVRAALDDYRPILDLFGQVVAGRAVDVTPAVGGDVVAVGAGFREGGLVEAGDLLIAIDPFDYEIALAERTAELAEAQARLAELAARLRLETEALDEDEAILALNEREQARQERLVATGAGTQRALDDARTTLLNQRRAITIRANTIVAEQARIDQQEAIVERLTARRDLARRNVERTRMVAPFAGIVDAITAEEGQRIRADEPVGRLIDPARMEVRFQISERDYGRLIGAGASLIGRASRITWRIGETPLTFEAAVERVDATIEATTGGVDVYAHVVGLDLTTPLRPGAFVEVALPGRLYPAVAELPAEALFETADGPVVYVVSATDQLESRQVALVASFDDRVLIADGVADGDRIVTSRFAGIADGIAVSTAD